MTVKSTFKKAGDGHTLPEREREMSSYRRKRILPLLLLVTAAIIGCMPCKPGRVVSKNCLSDTVTVGGKRMVIAKCTRILQGGDTSTTDDTILDPWP